tara:strand:+ start:188 stop:706 length:519 start_codon:yes stop_codon:yes gene_type:complete
LKNIKSYFDHTTDWDEYNLELSAYQKELNGDIKGAINDISLAINKKPNYHYLFFERGKYFFKIKNYDKAFNDLNTFIEAGKKVHYEAVFFKEICELIINKGSIQNDTIKYFEVEYKLHNKKIFKTYFLFINALEKSLNKDLYKDFRKDENYFLLEHLPIEMKPILNLCWEIF